MRQNNMVETIYLCMLIAYSIFREVVPAQFIVGNATLIIILFAAGLFIIIQRILSNRFNEVLINEISLVCFVLICVFSALINYKYSFIQNTKAIGWLILYFGFCYVYGYELRDKRIKKIVGAFAFAFISVLCALSLPMYFWDIDYISLNYNVIGTVSNQGFSNEYMRLWGVFADPNTGAVYALIAISVGIWLIISCRRRWMFLLIPSELVLFCYFVLSGSRTAFFAALIGGAFMIAGVLYIKLNKNRLVSCIGGIIGIVLVIIGCGVMKMCLPQVKNVIRVTSTDTTKNVIHRCYDEVYIYTGVEIESGISNLDAEILSNDSITLDSNQGSEVFERDDLNEKNDISNGRIAIWNDAVRLFLKAPLLGTSPRGASEFGKDNCPDNCISQWGYSAHNSWLELLMCTGVFGLSVMSYIVISSMFRGFKILLSDKLSYDDLLCMAVVLELLVASMLLSDLFFVFTFGGVTFWVVIGAVNSRNVQMTESCNDGKKRNRVLIYGPKDPTGGVERIVLEYVRNIVAKHQDISFDYLEYGRDFSQEEELKRLGCRVIYLPSRSKHYVGYKKAI